MNRFLYILLMFAWALWLGGIVALIMFVIRLFGTSHDLGVQAAPVLFRSFALFQLIVGTIACIAAGALSRQTKSKIHAGMTSLLTMALAACVLLYLWTMSMESLRTGGQSGSPEFARLHHLSSMLYTVAAALLVLAGIGFSATPPIQKAPEISQG